MKKIKNLIYNIVLKYFLTFYKAAKRIEQENIYKAYRNKYKIPKSFKFNGSGIILLGNGKIKIGNDSYIGRNSVIVCSKNADVIIGSNCRIAQNVRINSRTVDPIIDLEIKEKKIKEADIKIGDYSWIGVNVYIGPGITIGKSSVVGCNAVVTKDVPDYAIVGGVPAKIIKFKKKN